MLAHYTVAGYKSIDREEFKLSNLNLFSGCNSAGKSTALQALLLGADNLGQSPHSNRMVVRHLEPFSFNESRNYIKNSKEYAVEFDAGNGTSRVVLRFNAADDLMNSTNVTQSGTPGEDMYERLTRGLLYLPAFRTGELGSTKINPSPDVNPLGLNGQYVIDYYYSQHDSIVNDSIVKDRSSIVTLEGQLNYWLNRLMGYTIEVEPINSEYRVRYKTTDGKLLNPYHVGTGVSYITSVIIGCLMLPDAGLIIIENPEIHLHPSAQADMIDFLATMAVGSRQIIVESHSDHIFNGIRRLIHDRMLKTEDVMVYNFVKNIDGLTHAKHVELTAEGGIREYIPGMFEQFDRDLDALLR